MSPPEPSESEPTRIRGVKTANVNPQLVLRILAVVVILVLAITSVTLFVAGAHNNGQITDLKQSGVEVQVTATGCLGLLGGSGSNAAGYQCNGTFALNGHHYTDVLPGSGFYRPGDKVTEVVARDNPGLMNTARAVAKDRTSDNYLIAPSVLAVLAVGLIVLAVFRARRPLSPSG